MSKHLKKLIKKSQTLLADIADTRPGRRPPLIKRALDLVRRALGLAREEVAALDLVDADYADHPGRAAEAGLLRRRLHALTWSLVILSIPLQAVIARTSWGLSWLMATIVGCATTGLITLIAENVVIWLSHKADMPARAVRVCLAFAKGVGIAVVCGLLVLLGARVADAETVDALHLATVGVISLLTVAEGAALVAGCLAAAARWMGEPELLSEQVRELRATIAWLEEEEDRLDLGDEGVEDAPTGERTTVRAAALVSMLLVAAVSAVVAQSQHGTAPGTAVTAPREAVGRHPSVLPDTWYPTATAITPSSGVSSTAGAAAFQIQSARYRLPELPPRGARARDDPGGLCAIIIDNTLSVDSILRRRAVASVGQTLGAFVGNYRCTAVMLAWFTTSLDWAIREYYPLVRDLSPQTCDSAVSTRPGGLAAALNSMSGFQESTNNRVAVKCERARQMRVDSVRISLDNVCRALLSAPSPSGARTGIKRVVHDVVVGGRYNGVIVISDGLETVDSTTHTMPLPPNLITLVLVPSKSEFGGEDATERSMVGWAANYPGLRVVAYPEILSPGFWDVEGTRPDLKTPRRATCR